MFKHIGKIPLGRWRTNKPVEATLRLIDLANCDSCGTCGTIQRVDNKFLSKQTKHKLQDKEKNMITYNKQQK